MQIRVIIQTTRETVTVVAAKGRAERESSVGRCVIIIISLSRIDTLLGITTHTGWWTAVGMKG